MPDTGRMVLAGGDVGKLPNSGEGLYEPEEDASLLRARVCEVCGLCSLPDDDAVDSAYRVEESPDDSVLGDGGLVSRASADCS